MPPVASRSTRSTGPARDGASLAWPAPARVGCSVTGRPSIPWSATASTTPPATRSSSSAGGRAGLAALRQFARTVGLRFPGPLVATGGGGWHCWFRPTGLGNRPPRGLPYIDWRGIRGCVLAPPSRHASGRPYRWLRALDQAPLPEVPAALHALLDPDRPTTARLAHPTGPADPDWPPAVGHPYGHRVLAAELAALGRATPGQRNRTLNRCAFKVYRYVAGGVLDDQEVTLAFTTAALAIGLNAAETGRTLASARTAGLANPRTVPAAPGRSIKE